MMCSQCHEREAVIHLTQMALDQVTTLHLCERCAADKGVESAASLGKSPLVSLVAALGEGLVVQASEVAAGAVQFSCRNCGATLEDFRASGRLGCTECYRALAGPLRELLRRIHGATRHTGERYMAPGQPAAVPGVPDVSELREQLRRAVEAENFELAAQLRDRLRDGEQ